MNDEYIKKVHSVLRSCKKETFSPRKIQAFIMGYVGVVWYPMNVIMIFILFSGILEKNRPHLTRKHIF